ncbi:hypothetical protein AAFN88_08285 [Pelagibius sp. CAU 1746]|uniref:hypothetical protein n=1 Tax=Pelagibius sp. CAU 1746 TaxID=3140370 RepID=UPI00325AA372
MRQPFFTGSLAGLGLAMFLSVQPLTREAIAIEPLVQLAQPGPWSAIDSIIGYGQRIWFANQESFRNHNAADIYSYDPATGELRYERSLFSQGAGRPLTAEGLLYWPFEDPRFTANRAEFAVTNGTDWAWRILPEGEAFHLHVMTAHDGKLYAASSAWRANLQVSADKGATWQMLYDHPTPEGQVSRITSLASFQRRLYAGLTQRRNLGQRILTVTEEHVAPAPGWPAAYTASNLTNFRGNLFAILQDDDGSRLWYSDGGPAKPVGEGPSGQPLHALAAGEDTLWAITAGGGEGALWQSEDGLQWTKSQNFPNAAPISLAVYQGALFVGSIGPGGRGTLWGPRPPAALRRPPPGQSAFGQSAFGQSALGQSALGRPSPALPPAGRRSGGIERHLAALDNLTAPETLNDRDWQYKSLMPPLWALAQANLPRVGAALAARLEAALPERPLTIFGGKIEVRTSALARWYLLWAMAQQGGGRVPPALLAVPWDVPVNQPEKYFHPAPAAAWAMAQLGQGDRESLAALMARLTRPGDPDWLAGDIVGALTVLTGQRFGHDYGAWRSWWDRQRQETPSRDKRPPSEAGPEPPPPT